MPTVKKQLFAFTMLLLVALPVFLSVGFYIKQQIVQHQRIQRFKTELLETFTIKADKVYWVEAGKEIKINGKLFDIEYFKVSGNNIIFTGFFDHKEDKLLQQISKLAIQKNQSENPWGQQVIKFLFLPVYCRLNNFTLVEGNWQWVSKQYQPFFEIIPDAHLYPLIHPPC